MSNASPRPEFVSTVRRGPCAELELANPPLNLVTTDLLEQLHRALVALEGDGKLRCVVLHQGRARAFCAGSDMREFAALRPRAVQRKILFEEYILRQLAQLRCPTIAALDGPALGGGLELALACDLRVCSASAHLGLTESRIGGLGASGAVRLTRLIGPARASEMLFTGRTVQADQALEWGLINELTEDGGALERARAMAAEIAARGPLSNAYAKRLVAASLDQPSAAALSLANELQDNIFRSDDLQTGAKSFFERTVPSFEGR